MKACPACKDIKSRNDVCSRSDCPLQGSIALASGPRVDPGLTGKADQAVQSGFDKASNAARDTTGSAFFVLAAVFAAILVVTIFALKDGDQSQNLNEKHSRELDTIIAGTGPMPQTGDVVFINYKGKLASNGTVFDESQEIPLPVEGLFPKGTPFPIEEGATIPGFFEGLKQMQKGGKYELFIPAEMAYGAEPPPGAPIPPNADLAFEIEVVDVMSKATFERNLAILQQTMQAQMGEQGGAGGDPAPSQGQ